MILIIKIIAIVTTSYMMGLTHGLENDDSIKERNKTADICHLIYVLGLISIMILGGIK